MVTEKELKKELEAWGSASRLCDALHSELVHIKKQQDKLWSVPEEARKSLEDSYANRIEDISNEIIHIEEQQSRMDHYIKMLDKEESLALHLRYQMEISVDRICFKMHFSRATYFRKRNAAIRNLLTLMNDNKSEEGVA